MKAERKIVDVHYLLSLLNLDGHGKGKFRVSSGGALFDGFIEIHAESEKEVRRIFTEWMNANVIAGRNAHRGLGSQFPFDGFESHLDGLSGGRRARTPR